MKSKTFISFIVSILFLLSLCSKVIANIGEIGTSFDTATKLGAVDSTGTTANITSSGSSFYYLVKIEGTVTFTLNSSGNDYDLYLYNNVRDLVDYATTTSYPEVLTYTGNGWFFLRVNSWSGTGYYWLHWDIAPYSFSSAYHVQPWNGTEGVEGAFDSSHTSHYYWDNVAAGQRIGIVLNGADGTDFDLYVYDGSYNLIEKAIGTQYPETMGIVTTYPMYFKIYRSSSATGQYNLQIFQPTQYISGVPDYQQRDYPGDNDCAPTAAACVLGYWDSHGYSRLVDSGNEAPLVQDLKDNSDYDSGGTSRIPLSESIEIVCNDPDLNNNYGFSATYDGSASFSDFKNEILAVRPLTHHTTSHPIYSNHAMAGVGYSETSSAQWCIDHDNSPYTPEDVYVEWNSISNHIIKIVPGYANNKTISGYVRTSSSFGISGVTITFSHYDYQSSTWISDGTATTNSSGYYSFSAYYCWNGRATPSKSGFSFSPTYITHNDITSNQSNQNYTGTPSANPIISGYVRTSSGSGIDGVTMTFSNGGGTTTTNTSGYYSRSVAYGWSGTVTPSKTGYTFSPTNRSYSAVIANQSNQDYTGTPPPNPIISGYVRTAAGSGIDGVTMTFSNGGGTTTTNTSGYYSRSVAYGWSGTVTPSKTDYTFSPTNRSYSNVTSNQSNQDYTGTPPPNPIISGYVRTAAGSGIDGVTMTFSNGGGTTTTNTSGYYSRSVAYGWGGTVTPSKTGYTFSPTNRSYSNVTSNQSNQDYTGTPPPNPIISGYVRTAAGSGIDGVTMTFSNGGGTTTTNTSGYYSRSVAYGWGGTVTPSKTDYTFSPTNRSYSNVTSDQSSQNYTGTPVPTYGYSLLWTRDAGAHLWKFNPSGDWAGATGYGYSSGWTATTYQRNSDGSAQLLWTSDGSAHLWKFDSSGGWAGATGYGYAPGWTATCYQRNNDGSAQLLWTSDGIAHLWKFNSSGGWAGATGFGYTSGWTATSYQRNGDGSAQLLWTSNGSAQLWKFNPSGGWAGAIGYGYSSGWTATSYQRNDDGSAQLLWTNNGNAHLWKFNSSGGMTGATGYGYTSGWTATCYHNSTGSLTAAQQLSGIMLNYATEWTGTSYPGGIEPDITMNYEDIPGDFPGEVIQNPDDIVNQVNFAQQNQENFEIYNKLEVPYIIIKKAGTGGGTVTVNGLKCGYCMELIIPYDKNAMETPQVIPDDDSYFVRWETAKGVPLENIQDAQPGEVVIAVFDLI